MKDPHPLAPTADTNPYATPSTESLAPPEEKCPWYTAMRAVYVKDGAELPPIDLLGEDSGTPLIKTTRTLTKPTAQANVVTIVIFAFIGFFANRWEGRWHFFLLSIFFASYLLRFIFHFVYREFWMKRVKFTLYCTAKLERFRKMTNLAKGVSTVVCFAPALFVHQDFHLTAIVAGIVAFRMFDYGLKKFALKRYPLEMHFSESQPGWLRLGGAHPNALIKLKEIEISRDLSE